MRMRRKSSRLEKHQDDEENNQSGEDEEGNNPEAEDEEEGKEVPEPVVEKKRTPKKKSKSPMRKGKNQKKESEGDSDNSGGKSVYEVEKIIDIYFKKDGTKEFLVHWKGYSQSENTWEPEENLDCPDLIAKYMEKVDNAKLFEKKELRTKRTHTIPYTLATQAKDRRLSKRIQNKERVYYHDAE